MVNSKKKIKIFTNFYKFSKNPVENIMARKVTQQY